MLEDCGPGDLSYAAPRSGRERCIRRPVRLSRMSGSRRGVMTASCVAYPTRRTIWGYSANGDGQGVRRLGRYRFLQQIARGKIVEHSHFRQAL